MASPVSPPPPAFVCPCSVCVREGGARSSAARWMQSSEASHDPPRSHAGGTKALGNAGAHPVRSGSRFHVGRIAVWYFSGASWEDAFAEADWRGRAAHNDACPHWRQARTRLTQEMAIDACWGYIESASIGQLENGIEWMDVSDELHNHEDEFRLLIALGLAEVHSEHPTWIREIATL